MIGLGQNMVDVLDSCYRWSLTSILFNLECLPNSPSNSLEHLVLGSCLSGLSDACAELLDSSSFLEERR